MGTKRVLIVDALNAYLRAYIVDPSVSTNGQPIGGLKGFIKILQKLVRQTKPNAVVICWDGPNGSKKRKTMDKNYKEGRKPIRLNRSVHNLTDDEELQNKIWQQGRVVEYINNMPIIQTMLPEIEADDVISYVKSSTMFKDWQKVIVSADKDFIQLLDNKTLLFRPIQKEVLSLKTVVEKFGIHPRNFALARAMAGDPSDNLPGVPRVGLGTVAKRFSFLSSDKDFFLEDIMKESKSSKNKKLKVYQNIVDCEKIIKENYDIMQLSSPQMSIQSKNKIDDIFEGYRPHYNQTEMRKLMIQDGVLTVNMQNLEQKFNDIITSFSN